MKPLAAALLALVATACSSQVAVRLPANPERLAEVNRGLTGREVTFQDRSGDRVETRETERAALLPTRLTWSNPGMSGRAEVPAAALGRVRILDRARGGREGLGIGALIGLAGVVPFAITLANPSQCHCGEGLLATGALGLGSHLAGSLVGLSAGGAIGHTTNLAVGAGPPTGEPRF